MVRAVSCASAALFYGVAVILAEWEPPADIGAMWRDLGFDDEPPEAAEFLAEAARCLGLDETRTDGGAEGEGSVLLVGVEYGTVEGAGRLVRVPKMPPASKRRRIALLRRVCGLDAPGWVMGARE